MRFLSITLVALALTVPLIGQSESRIREAARTILADRHFQTELPLRGPVGARPADGDTSGPGQGNSTDKFGSGGEADARDSSRRRLGPRGAPVHRGRRPELNLAAGSFWQVLLWILGVVIVVLIVWWFVTEFRGHSREASSRKSSQPGAEGARTARSHGLPDFEALARAGQFAEAIHVLLLLAIGRLARGRGASFPLAATSREILSSQPQAKGVSECLAGMVNAVERIHFGGARADAADYEETLARFQELKQACPHPTK